MKKYILFFLVLFAVVGMDQGTKHWADQSLHRPATEFCPSTSCQATQSRCAESCQKEWVEAKNKLHSSKDKEASLKKEEAKKNLCVLKCKETHKTCLKKNEKQEKICQKEHKLAQARWDEKIEQLKKSWFCKSVEPSWIGSYPKCVVIDGFFNLKYETNPGAAFGIFAKVPSHFRRPFFIAITVLAILFILYTVVFQILSHQILLTFSISLVLAGAIGNFIDRIRFNYVIDFIDWYVLYGKGKVYHWPTFNIADVAIVVGVLLIGIDLFFGKDSAKKKPKKANFNPVKQRSFDSLPPQVDTEIELGTIRSSSENHKSLEDQEGMSLKELSTELDIPSISLPDTEKTSSTFAEPPKEISKDEKIIASLLEESLKTQKTSTQTLQENKREQSNKQEALVLQEPTGATSEDKTITKQEVVSVEEAPSESALVFDAELEEALAMFDSAEHIAVSSKSLEDELFSIFGDAAPKSMDADQSPEDLTSQLQKMLDVLDPQKEFERTLSNASKEPKKEEFNLGDFDDFFDIENNDLDLNLDSVFDDIQLSNESDKKKGSSH